MTLPQVLDRSAERFGSAPFVSDASRILTFEELARSSVRCAAWLAEQGIGPGMNVLLYLPNSVTWVESYFGLLRAGARPVLVLSSHGRVELTHVARKAEAVAIITTGRVGVIDYSSVAHQVGQDLPGLEVLDLPVANDPPWRWLPDPEPVELPEICPEDVAVLQLSGGHHREPEIDSATS